MRFEDLSANRSWSKREMRFELGSSIRTKCEPWSFELKFLLVQGGRFEPFEPISAIRTVKCDSNRVFRGGADFSGNSEIGTF